MKIDKLPSRRQAGKAEEIAPNFSKDLRVFPILSAKDGAKELQLQSERPEL